MQEAGSSRRHKSKKLRRRKMLASSAVRYIGKAKSERGRRIKNGSTPGDETFEGPERKNHLKRELLRRRKTKKSSIVTRAVGAVRTPDLLQLKRNLASGK